jgi:hypothetical protein
MRAEALVTSELGRLALALGLPVAVYFTIQVGFVLQ